MKQKIFTLVMMLALVIVAGSAMAQTNMNPYSGSDYSYSLDYTLANAGEVTLTLTGPGTLNGATTPLSLTSGGSAVPLSSGAGNIVIPIRYPTGASGTQTIAITIEDNVSNCSNNIYLTVTIQDPPTIALTVTPSGSTCMDLNDSPGSNIDASAAPTTANTFTFTVSPTIVAAGTPTYEFSIGLDNYAFGSTSLQWVSGGTASTTSAITTGTMSVTAIPYNVSPTFTVSYTTTEGAHTFTANAASIVMHMEAVNGGADINGTNTSGAQYVALPTIGQFN